MKTAILFLCITLLPAKGDAAPDSAIVQVFYDATCKDQAEKPVENDYQVLEIGEHFITNLINSSDNMPEHLFTACLLEYYP